MDTPILVYHGGVTWPRCDAALSPRCSCCGMFMFASKQRTRQHVRVRPDVRGAAPSPTCSCLPNCTCIYKVYKIYKIHKIYKL